MKTISCLLGVVLFVPLSAVSDWSRPYLGTDSQYRCFVVDGTNLFAGSARGVWRSRDYGLSWSLTSSPTAWNVGALVVKDGYLFAGTYAHGAFRSTDNGATWNSCGTLGTEVNALVVSGTDIIAGTGGVSQVWRSTNNGTDWTAIMTIGATVRSLAVRGTTLIIGADDGIYRTTNNGVNWSKISTPRDVYSLVASGTTILAGSATAPGGIYRSTDDGVTWNPSGLNTTQVFSVAAIDTTFFAGRLGGDVYRSTADGTFWHIADEGLLMTDNVMTLAVCGGYLFAGTNGSGIWRVGSVYLVTSIPERSVQIPNEFRLEQNYPNPFNPSTAIRYGLPHKSVVELKVYNAIGQQVALLVNGEQDAGYYEVRFDGSGLSSGAYFYRLRAEGFVQTRRLLLLK